MASHPLLFFSFYPTMHIGIHTPASTVKQAKIKGGKTSPMHASAGPEPNAKTHAQHAGPIGHTTDLMHKTIINNKGKKFLLYIFKN